MLLLLLVSYMPPRLPEQDDEREALIAFGKRVRELRKAKGWSQDELAFQAGLDRTYVSGIERGIRNVSFINIHRLAVALNVDLLGG